MGRTRRAAGDLAPARLVAGAGLVAVIAGAASWFTVRWQLAAERIVIPPSARWLPGRAVQGPVTALAQAEAIRRTALQATDGRTYGQLASDDAAAEMAMNASLLRASLFTSVLAFGVAAAAIALGGVLLVIGAALSRVDRRPSG